MRATALLLVWILAAPRLWADDLQDRINALRGKDERARTPAIEAIRSLGAGSVPGLMVALQDPDRWVRGGVALALGQLGADAAPAVGALGGLLRGDPDLGVRADAANALAGVGAPSVSLLTACLSEPDVFLRRVVMQALGQIGPPAEPATPALAGALSDERDDIRSAAQSALMRIGPAAAPRLREELRSANERACTGAAAALAGIGGAEADVLPVLLRALRKDELRRDAVHALGQVGEPAIAPLEKALQDEQVAVRRAAAQALGSLARTFRAAAHALVDAVLDPQEEVRTVGARALGQLGAAAAEAVPDLIEVLAGEKRIDLRRSVVVALGEIGPAAAPAIPTILRELTTHLPEDPLKPGEDLLARAIRQAAAHALGRVASAPDQSVPALALALQGEEAEVRLEAAAALGCFGPAGKSAVPALIQALSDANPELVGRAAESLGQIGPEAVAAVDALEQLKRRSNPFYSVKVVEALEKIRAK